MSRLSEELQFVPLIEAEDYAGAGKDSDCVDLSRFHTFSAIFQFGDITGNSILKVYAAPTAALAVAKTGYEIAFSYRLAAADTGATLADTFGDATAVASTGLTLTAATYDHKVLLVEFDCDTMTTTNRYLVFEIDATANPMEVSAVGVAKPRFPGHAGVTAL